MTTKTLKLAAATITIQASGGDPMIIRKDGRIVGVFRQTVSQDPDRLTTWLFRAVSGKILRRFKNCYEASQWLKSAAFLKAVK